MAFLGLSSAPTDRAAVLEVDRINVGLALVNWCFLLLLMCALLLAKTLPADTALTSGFAAEDCKPSKTVSCSEATSQAAKKK